MNKNKKPMKKAMDAVKAFISKESLQTDPNGSYTGKCENEKEKPIQDADDL